MPISLINIKSNPSLTANINTDTVSYSGSAYAAKGMWFEVTADLEISQVTCLIGFNSGSYKLVLVEEDTGVSRQIGAVLGTSNTVASATDNGEFNFVFDTPVKLSSSFTAKYGLMLVRIGGAATDVCSTSFSANPIHENAHFTNFTSTRALDIDPQVGDDYSFADGTEGVNNGIYAVIHYSLT